MEQFRRGITLVPELRKGFIRIHKNASTAVKNTLEKEYVVRNVNLNEVPTDINRLVTLWRNPYDRISSAYSFLKRHYDESQWAELEGIPNLNDPFCRWVLKIPKRMDAHLSPQVEGIATEIPVKVIRWDFYALRTEFDLNDLPAANETPHEVYWSKEAKNFVDEFYAADWRVWRSENTYLQEIL